MITNIDFDYMLNLINRAYNFARKRDEKHVEYIGYIYRIYLNWYELALLKLLCKIEKLQKTISKYY